MTVSQATIPEVTGIKNFLWYLVKLIQLVDDHPVFLLVAQYQIDLFGGLSCPPLIPAGIQRNPGNSRNSRGINFGRGTCQIGKTIPAEFQTEFEFRQNAGITIDGITPERNLQNVFSAQ
jgi:hypothetical protein